MGNGIFKITAIIETECEGLMLDADFLLKLVIGFVALVSGFIVRDRQLHKTIQIGDEKLHNRINEVRETFVRRADFEHYIASTKTEMDRAYHELHATNKKIEKILDLLYDLEKRQ